MQVFYLHPEAFSLVFERFAVLDGTGARVGSAWCRSDLTTDIWRAMETATNEADESKFSFEHVREEMVSPPQAWSRYRLSIDSVSMQAQSAKRNTTGEFVIAPNFRAFVNKHGGWSFQHGEQRYSLGSFELGKVVEGPGFKVEPAKEPVRRYVEGVLLLRRDSYRIEVDPSVWKGDMAAAPVLLTYLMRCRTFAPRSALLPLAANGSSLALGRLQKIVEARNMWMAVKETMKRKAQAEEERMREEAMKRSRREAAEEREREKRKRSEREREERRRREERMHEEARERARREAQEERERRRKERERREAEAEEARHTTPSVVDRLMPVYSDDSIYDAEGCRGKTPREIYSDLLEVGGKSQSAVAEAADGRVMLSRAKKDYRKLALQLHPDKNKAPDAKERFQLLSSIYQTMRKCVA